MGGRYANTKLAGLHLKHVLVLYGFSYIAFDKNEIFSLVGVIIENI